MRKFLLIDDDVNRKDNYIKFFDFIEIEYLTDYEMFQREDFVKYDGFIVDIIYNDKRYESLTFESVIKKIPSDKPIFIISGNWEKAMDQAKMNVLSENDKYKNVLGYFSWETINSDINSTIQDFAKTQFNHFFRFTFEKFDKDESLVILQISDLEFGNPSQKEFIKTERSILLSKIRGDLHLLDKNKPYVDYIVICGDIAHTGTTEQFKYAELWINELSDELLFGSKKEKIIIVPGNHDYNIDSTLGNYYCCEYIKKDTKGKKVEKFKIRKLDEQREHYSNLGMLNFSRFIFSITGEDELLKNPYDPIIIKRFENIGINFILINPVKFLEEMKFGYKLDDEYCSKIIKAFKNTNNQKMTNIIVSHISHSVINMKDESAGTTEKIIEDLVSEINAKIWLYGHAHQNAKIDDITIGNRKVCISQSNSLLLTNSAICDGSQSGYTLLKLERSNNIVNKVAYLSEEGNNGREVKYIISPF